MDRQIVYPGAIPLETDLLNTNRFTMIAIAKLAASVMGSNTYLNGLACTASSPASMVINIAPGEIYSLQNIDSTAYSSLPADTAHSILKQGILLSATSFTLAAPSTAGQSINYLIQVAFQDVDSGATVLPYYNASNPSQAYSGPNNSGIAQNTIRSGVCSVSVKTGVSATTGSQVTPSPDAGYVGAYVVTVNQGQTTITSTSINLAANAPFLPKNGLVSGVQSNTMNYSADTGTANNYVASYFPAVTQLTDGLRLTFKAKNSNTASSTFSPNGLASAPIYTRAAGALTGGEIAQNKIMEVEWNSTLSAWTLISGSDPLAIGALQKSANLSDLQSTSTARTNLGLGGAAVLNVGTTVGTVAAGDDPRITASLLKANNLSDLTNVPAALSNLRLERLDQDTNETRIWSPDKRSYILVQNRAWGMYSINYPAGVIPLGLGFGGTGAKDAPGARTNLELGNSATRNVGTGENQIPDMSAWTSGGNSNAGWRRSPDGFIEQWGIIKVSASTTVTTPIPFPNAMYTAIATGDPTYSSGVETAQAWVQSNNTFIISGGWVIAGNIGTTTNMNTSWRAWGR